MLKLVGLSEFADKYPKELSGGMRQLVAIARVLVMDVQLLLLDEPFAALDAISRQRMQEQLMDICLKAGTTNLFITHSVDEAILSCRSGSHHVEPTRINQGANRCDAIQAARHRVAGVQRAARSGTGIAGLARTCKTIERS